MSEEVKEKVNKEVNGEINEEIMEKTKEAPDKDEGKDGSGDTLPGDSVLPPIVAKEVVMPMSSYGIGPVFTLIAVALTVLGIFFRNRWIFSSGIPTSNVLRYTYIGLGVVLILAGGKILLDALFTSRINDYIRANKLCTEGVYAWMRNPIYTAILFICTGALFISGNVYMYLIPLLLWGILTLLLKKTEEPLLVKRFGQDYTDYMASVNRIFPKPPKK